MGKKQRKLEAQLKIAELKTACERPDVVEVWDITSHDPHLLVFLKVGTQQSNAVVSSQQQAVNSPALAAPQLQRFTGKTCLMLPGLPGCLQGYRNTVPVPRHWSQKRKYLQVWQCSVDG
jgi:splicing factor 3B subunit 2